MTAADAGRLLRPSFLAFGPLVCYDEGEKEREVADMRIDRSLIKSYAREDMRRAKPSVLLVTLMFLLLTNGVRQLVSLVTSTGSSGMSYQDMMNLIYNYGMAPEEALRYFMADFRVPILSIFLSVLVSLFVMVVTFGYQRYTLNLARCEEAGYRDLKMGFAYTGRVLGMNLLIWLYSVLWSLAVAVPGVIVIMVLAMIFGGSGLGILFVVAAYLAIMVAVIVLILRYAQADLALAENPELGALGAIRRSKELMIGRKGEYFVLGLSFIGWNLLALVISSVAVTVASAIGTPLGLVAGGGNLAAAAFSATGWFVTLISSLAVLPYSMWLTSYINVTYAHYYLAITEPERRAAGGPPPPQDSGYRGPEPF